MNIKSELLRERSKAQTLRIADFIGNVPERFDELMELFFFGEPVERQRAAWVFRYSAEANPKLVESYLYKLVEHLGDPVHDAIKRSILCVLKVCTIPEDLLGILAEHCFNLLANPKEAIALRVFSMEILYRICIEEPGLTGELKMLIEDEYPYASAGFKSKARKVLKGLSKLKTEDNT